jgi:hypothetical protein
MMKQWFFFSLIFPVLFSSVSFGKTFRNAYVSFEMNDNWDCQLEHTEWVCRTNIQTQAKEAIIILTAKELGPTDTFESYRAHLNKPLQPAYKGANQSVSQVKYVKDFLVNGQTWIDGLHSGSEIPNYFTRYIATIKDRIAILVTFSAHKDFYSKYGPEFYKSVMSLRVVATANLLNDPNSGPLRGSNEPIGIPIGAQIPGGADMVADPNGGSGDDPSRGGGRKTKLLLLAVAVLLAGGAGYVLMKPRKGS